MDLESSLDAPKSKKSFKGPIKPYPKTQFSNPPTSFDVILIGYTESLNVNLI